MLILTRRPGESIRIGDEVTITILGTNGNQVRIGITAPRSVAVHREEVYERIHAEHACDGQVPTSVDGRAHSNRSSAEDHL